MSTGDPHGQGAPGPGAAPADTAESPGAGKPLGEPIATPGAADPMQQLEQRIHAARQAQERPRSGDADMARGLMVVTSLGFSLAGSIVGGIWVGRALAARTGQAWWSEVGLLVGILSGFAVAAHLLKPFLRPR